MGQWEADGGREKLCLGYNIGPAEKLIAVKRYRFVERCVYVESEFETTDAEDGESQVG